MLFSFKHCQDLMNSKTYKYILNKSIHFLQDANKFKMQTLNLPSSHVQNDSPKKQNKNNQNYTHTQNWVKMFKWSFINKNKLSL